MSSFVGSRLMSGLLPPAEKSKTPKARTIRKDPCDSKGYTHTHLASSRKNQITSNRHWHNSIRAKNLSLGCKSLSSEWPPDRFDYQSSTSKMKQDSWMLQYVAMNCIWQRHWQADFEEPALMINDQQPDEITPTRQCLY